MPTTETESQLNQDLFKAVSSAVKGMTVHDEKDYWEKVAVVFFGRINAFMAEIDVPFIYRNQIAGFISGEIDVAKARDNISKEKASTQRRENPL